MFIRVLTAISMLLIGGVLMVAAQEESKSITLAVYNEGTALIREQVKMTFAEGLNAITLRDVPATIDPTSFNFKSLSDPAGTTVLEQNYRYDSGDAAAMLADFIGETVDITMADGERYTGELLRLGDGEAILRASANEIAFVNLATVSRIQFPTPPADYYAGPTLQLLLNSASGGEQDVALTYLAGGLNWTADYNIFLNAEENALDLTGLVTLTNRSGRGYQDAKLKLVAGDVSRIEPELELSEAREERMVVYSSQPMADSAAVSQRDLSEYKVYEVERPIAIESKQTKQIEFVSGAGIAAKTSFILDSLRSYRGYSSPYLDNYDRGEATDLNVNAVLEFNTGDESGLGAALPAGRVRIYQADIDGSSLLIGESEIEHSPKGEDLKIELGNAFDLRGERIQYDFSLVSRRVARESFVIRLRNQKEDEAVEIIVPERLYRWNNWQIIDNSAPFVKANASTIEFTITVEPGAEAVLRYTVEYSFPERRY